MENEKIEPPPKIQYIYSLGKFLRCKYCSKLHCVTGLLKYSVSVFCFQRVGANFVFLLNRGEHRIWCRRPRLSDRWADRAGSRCSQRSCFHPKFPSRIQHCGRRKGRSPLRCVLLLFVAKRLCSKKLFKHFLSQCYFLIRLLSLEFMKLTFLFSQISFVCDNSPIPFTFHPRGVSRLPLDVPLGNIQPQPLFLFWE